jgi:hypothetical protein
VNLFGFECSIDDNNAKVLTLISRLQMNVGKIRLIEVCCKLIHGLVTKHIYFLDEMFSMWFAGAGEILDAYFTRSVRKL